jgi:hypothetical protein
MKLKGLTVTILSIVMITMLSGCGSKVDVNEVRKYSDNITETLLVAGNNEDYETYLSCFDKNLQALITKDKFGESMKLIKGKIGNYVPKSASFQKAVNQSKDGKKYTTVIYLGKFTDEPNDVLITIVYGEENNHPVTTFLLNSPKLRQK